MQLDFYPPLPHSHWSPRRGWPEIIYIAGNLRNSSASARQPIVSWSPVFAKQARHGTRYPHRTRPLSRSRLDLACQSAGYCPGTSSLSLGRPMHPYPAHPLLLRRTPQLTPPCQDSQTSPYLVEWVLNFAIWDLSLPPRSLTDTPPEAWSSYCSLTRLGQLPP